MIYCPKGMFLVVLTAYPTLRISCVPYEFSHPIVLSWSGQHTCFTFRRSHFHTSTRRPGTLNDVFLCLLQSLQTNNTIVGTTPVYTQPSFRCRLNSIQSLYTEVTKHDSSHQCYDHKYETVLSTHDFSRRIL